MDPQPTVTFCYRHPDRETRLSCSSCGRPICVECTHDAAVGQKCPVCAAPDPGSRARVIDGRRAIGGPSASSTPVVIGLIAINVAIFLLTTLSPEFDRRAIVDFSQFKPAIESGEWWRIFTAMFLHGGVTHILFNMYALWIFGPVLEKRLGSVGFASLYLASGLAGGACYHLIGGDIPAVGASGAIFGLFGAVVVTGYQNRHTPAGRAVYTQLLVLLAINAALPFVLNNIAWEAHLGGLLAGTAIMAVWDRLPGPMRVGPRIAIAAFVALAAIGVVLVV